MAGSELTWAGQTGRGRYNVPAQIQSRDVPREAKHLERVAELEPRVEIVDSRTRFEELQNEWTRLAQGFASPLFQHEWFSACLKAFCPPGKPRIYVFRSEGEIKAIAPLVMTRRHGLRQLEILGSAELFEPAGILFSDKYALDRLFEIILREKLPMVLRRLPPEPVVHSLSENATARKHFVIEHENTSPWIPIRSSWAEFEAAMKSKHRSGIRRVRKRLEKNGKVSIEHYGAETPGLDQALEQAYRIEASGWKGRNGTAILSSHLLKAFFSEYAYLAEQKGLIRIFLLKVGTEPIAMAFGIAHAKKLWVLKVGYDESWSSYAPGILLHHEIIRWAFEHHLDGFEFLGSSEPFIVSRWSPELHTYRSYRIFPKTAGGIVWLATEACRTLGKRIVDAIVTMRS